MPASKIKRDIKLTGIEVIPSAKRLIKSLRDMGYDFSQAIADIVDNSIEAGATVVKIDVQFDGDDSWVRIADNGKGMKPEQLREAMRYGAERNYEKDDLGKFGLGLKTASMSQCQCLSVASRWNPNRADIAAYSWDLDHIESTNRWEILPIEKNELGNTIREPLKEARGTVVLWQRLDRVLGYKHPYGESARKRLLQTCREIELHLGMVFHRFLMGEARNSCFKLVVNGNDVKPWDPFCRSEVKTKKLQAVTIPVEYEGSSGEVYFEPFVLPHQADFSSPEGFHRAGGPANWNQQQGFYIYRAGRMIQSGGWCNLRAPDEHTKLARVAVSFSPSLDEAFKINVAKMRVQMPSSIRDSVRDATGPVVKIAREIYDRKTVKSGNASVSINTMETTSAMTPSIHLRHSAHVSCSSNSASSQGLSLAAKSQSVYTREEWAAKMLDAATQEERLIIQIVLDRIVS